MASRNYYTTVVMGPTGDPNLILSLDAGLASSYPGSGSTWTDISGNSNNFSLFGSFAYNAGFGGGCLEFQGSGEYAQFANGFGTFNKQEYTVIVWWYYTGSEAFQGIWSYDFTSHAMPFYGQHIRASTTSLNYQYNLGASAFGGVAFVGGFTVGAWCQVAMTCKFNTNPTFRDYRFYKNGTDLGAAQTAVAAPVFYNQPVWIGRLNFDNTQNAKFAIAKFYDKALTTAELLTEFNANRARFGL